jgi:hypothetical protein
MSTDLAPRTVLRAEREPQTLAGLLGLHDLDRGVVVCHPVPPRAGGAGQLALDVLHALGKRPSAGGWPRRSGVAAHYAKVWLEAERVGDLVLVRAGLFAPAALAELVSLAREAGTRTWLAFDDPKRRRAAGELLSARAVDAVQPSGGRCGVPTPGGARARAWPTPSPWLARAAGARTFTAQEFNDIDARMHNAFKATSTYIRSQRELGYRSLQHFPGVMTVDPVPLRRHARLIGVGCALLQHGFAVEIRERPIAAKPAVLTPTRTQAAQLRRHASPASAAFHALKSLTDLDDITIQSITLDQVIETASGVWIGGYLLQGAAAAALRAQRTAQYVRGFAPSQTLFMDARIRDDVALWGRGDIAPPITLEVKLARLSAPLDISFHQPHLEADLQAPSQETQDEAELILRLLRLTPSRDIPLTRLSGPRRAAAARLTATSATSVHEGFIAASDHLRFSQFLFDPTHYMANHVEPRPWHLQPQA